ncbi:MAG: hypothetical protein GC184_08815 [Rhizobiales bacterium]|nr:hypothetical protein [Hyphomicrobiales bacterium]
MSFRSVVTRVIASLAFVGFLSGAVLVQPVAAAAPGPAVVLVVSMETLFTQSKAAQSLRTQVQAEGKKLQDKDKSVKSSLEADMKKLSEQRSLLTQEDVQKKFQAIQEREAKHEQEMRAKAQAIQLGGEQARGEIAKALGPIFADIMKSKGGSIMLDRAAVVAGGVDLDVTAEALKALDAKMTSVKFTPITPK